MSKKWGAGTKVLIFARISLVDCSKLAIPILIFAAFKLLFLVGCCKV
jgi:hypothetical protein